MIILLLSIIRGKPLGLSQQTNIQQWLNVEAQTKYI